MRLWRRRSPFACLDLPKRCFISHSYGDVKVRERLLTLLPPTAEPFVFPPIVAPPEQMVSDKLLDAIRSSDGLIYLQGGASAKSFWVALERDYALRIGKPTYAYDPANMTLTLDHSSPLDLNVFIASTHHDHDRVLPILSVLRERFIELKFDYWQVPREGETDPEIYDSERWKAGFRIQAEIKSAIEEGGYVVTFWSSNAAHSEWVTNHLHTAIIERFDRLLFALIDDTPLPRNVEDDSLYYEVSKVRRGVYPNRAPLKVQIYGDSERTQAQRIDDLIVRLYWLIYRNTRQNQLS